VATPLWRRAVDTVEGALAPRLETALRSDAAALGLTVVTRANKGLQARAEGLSRHVLHALNLPAATDVHRVLGHVASVERELQSLKDAVAEHGVELDRAPLRRQPKAGAG
jgi:hypothetical protein